MTVEPASRPRSARHSATISIFRPRGCRGLLGRHRGLSPTTRRCPKARGRWLKSCGRRRELDRRLAQIGIVDGATGAALQKQLKPGQRLVTREGAVWRWDGYVASADAPTPAAQRLAQKKSPGRTRPRGDAGEEKVTAAEAGRSKRRRSSAPPSTPSARRARRGARPSAGWARPARRLPPPSARRASCRRGAAALDEARARIESDIAESHSRVGAGGEGPGRGAGNRGPPAARSPGTRLPATAPARRGAGGNRGALRREGEERQRRLEAIARERQSWQSAQPMREEPDRSARRAPCRGRARDGGNRRRARVRSRSSAGAARRRFPRPRAAQDGLRPAGRGEARQAEFDRLATRCDRGAGRGARGAGARRGAADGGARAARRDEARIREALECAPHEVDAPDRPEAGRADARATTSNAGWSV